MIAGTLTCPVCEGLRPLEHRHCYVCGTELVERAAKSVGPHLCRLCGRSLGPWAPRNQLYCSACQDKARNDSVRRWYWRHHHGCEPPPRPTLCKVCGRPLPEGINMQRRWCCDFCRRVLDAERVREWLRKHPEKYARKLAKEKERGKRLRAARRQGRDEDAIASAAG